MAIDAMPLIFKHLGVRFSACTKTTVWKGILMADANQMAHEVIWDALASCARRLMRRPWIVFIRSTGPCPFLEDSPLKTYVFEHV